MGDRSNRLWAAAADLAFVCAIEARMKSAIIIPALNEAQIIGSVVSSVVDKVDRVIVVDNGSNDGTGQIAAKAGAHVVYVEKPGYGRACLAGAAACPEAELLVFMDGDGADDPDDFGKLIAPIISDKFDFIVGSRAGGDIERGAMTIPQRFGNKLAAILMKLFWKSPFTDLGPFRAIKRESFDKLALDAQTFGWTVQMQVRALKQGMICGEVNVRYRKRIGKSKISGTVKGVILAGYYIIGTILMEAFRAKPATP